MTVNYSIASTLTVKDELTAVLERIAKIGKQVNREMSTLTKNLGKLGAVFDGAASSAGKFAEKQGKAFSTFRDDASRAVSAARDLNRELVALSQRTLQPLRGRSAGGMVVQQPFYEPAPRMLPGRDTSPRRVIDIGGHSTTDPYWVPPGGGGGGGGRAGFLPGPGGGGRGGGGIVPMGGGGGGGIVPPGGAGSGGGGGNGPGGGGGGRRGGGGAANSLASMYAGGIIKGWGEGIAGVLGDAAKDAAAYTHQLELMKVAGMSAKDVAQATSVAWKTSREIATTTATSNLQMIGELRSVLPDVNLSISEAVHFLPQVAKLDAVMASLNHGKSPEGLAYATLRAVEMMGGTVDPKTGKQDTDRAAKMIDAITQAAIMSHGKITPNEWVGFAQQASAVVKNMDPAKIIRQNATLIMEMGGKRAGTALTSMNQQVVGGIMPQRMVDDWEKYGLINMKKVSKTRTGVRLAPGAIKGEDVFKGEGGALDWIENIFIPTLKKAGLDNKQISDNIIRLFGRQTTQREASLMITQQQQIQRDIEMQKRAAKASGSFSELSKSDPETLGRSYESQKTNMMTAIGRVAMPTVIRGMQYITNLFTTIGEFATKHPTIMKALVMAVAVFAAFAIVFGSILAVVGTVAAVAAVAGGGGVIAIIAGIAAGITAIGAAVLAINWSGVLSDVKTWLSNIVSAVSNWLSSMVNAVRSHLPSWLGGIDKPPAPGAAASTPPVDASRGYGGASADKHSNSQLATMIADKLNGAKVMLDGQAVGSFMFDHINRESMRPSTGTSSFDTRLGPLRPDYGF